MEVALPERRFTVDEFHRVAEAGVLDPDERVELLDGRIVEMAAIGSRHAACVKRLNLLVVERLGREVVVGVQDPVRIDRHTELVPDLALLRPRDDFYAGGHPRAEDVLLIVEVADTTVEQDRRVKVPTYGRAGIPETWLVHLRDRRVEVYRRPSPSSGYRESTSVPASRRIESSSVAGLVVEAGDLLG